LYINQRKWNSYKDELDERIEHQIVFLPMGREICSTATVDGLIRIYIQQTMPSRRRLPVENTSEQFDNIDLYNNRVKVGLYRQYHEKLIC
jgi:hypothetical protein